MPSKLHIVMMTALAITAFAANSIICRAALGPGLIDPATFTTVRLVSAAAMLAVVVFVRRRHLPQLPSGDWRAAVALFVYQDRRPCSHPPHVRPGSLSFRCRFSWISQ
ncbi:MAG: hypothetical protein RIB80_00020 [Rhodospirillales bacterium]